MEKTPSQTALFVTALALAGKILKKDIRDLGKDNPDKCLSRASDYCDMVDAVINHLVQEGIVEADAISQSVTELNKTCAKREEEVEPDVVVRIAGTNLARGLVAGVWKSMEYKATPEESEKIVADMLNHSSFV